MRTEQHNRHLRERVSHNNCQECRADVERRFLSPAWRYDHVGTYLEYVRPRLEAIRTKANGGNSASAVHWRAEFRRALDQRITLKAGPEIGRKRCPSYLERMGQFPRKTDAAYLRRFARRGASTLT